MLRLNSYKEKQTNRQNLHKQNNLNLLVPSVKPPNITAALVDLPRFKSRPQISDVKYYSSDKAKIDRQGGFVQQFQFTKQ